jgi:elongation factor 1-beta
MANVVATLKIMPKSPEIDLDKVQVEVLKHIKEFAGEGETKNELEPIAFGLKALKIIFVMDESLGSTEKLEEEIKTISGIQSVEVTDVRRAIG